MVINGAIIHLFLKDFYASSEQSIISFLEDPSPKMKKKKKILTQLNLIYMSKTL